MMEDYFDRKPYTIKHTKKGVIRVLQTKAAEIARDLGVAPEVLTQKRVIEELVRCVLAEGGDDLPDELQGWRAEAVGRPLLELLVAQRGGVKLA